VNSDAYTQNFTDTLERTKSNLYECLTNSNWPLNAGRRFRAPNVFIILDLRNDLQFDNKFFFESMLVLHGLQISD